MALSYDVFLSRVMPEVPGCAEIVATQAIRDAVIKFCADTLVYQVDLDPVTAIRNLAVYDLEPPTATNVVAIMDVRFNGVKLAPVSQDVIRPEVQGTPRAYSQIDSDTFIVTPVPDANAAMAMKLRVALAPTLGSVECEDFLYNDWVEAIVHSALQRLQTVPGKAYTNPPTALWHGKMYTAFAASAQVSANKGLGRADLRVQMRPFA